MSKLDDALNTYSRLATQLKSPKRTPTGIFPVDYYLDGGFVEGFIHTVAGKYKGGKTTTIAKTIAESQKKYPHKEWYWFDMEGTIDINIEKLIDHGVQLDKLIIVRPETGGEAADIICALIEDRCDKIGVIAIDSLNRLLNSKEFEKEADEHTIAYNADIVTKLLKRVSAKLLAKSFITEDRPLVLTTSQIRANMGFGFKDYKIPGAKALEHDSSTILVSMPGQEFEDTAKKELAFADFRVIFDKVKMSTFHIKQIEYKMCIGRQQTMDDDTPIPTGYIDDFAFLFAEAKRLGIYVGGGNKQRFDTPELSEVIFANQSEIISFLFSNPVVYAQLKNRLIEARRIEKKLLGREPYMEYMWNPPEVKVDVQEEAKESKSKGKKK